MGCFGKTIKKWGQFARKCFHILFSINLGLDLTLLLERTLECFVIFLFTLFVSVDRKISLLRVQTSFTTTHRNGIGQPDYTTEYAKLVGRIILFVSECHGQMHKTSLTYISITSRYEPNDVNWVRCVMTNNLFRYYIKHLNREHWDVLNQPIIQRSKGQQLYNSKTIN